MTSVYQPEQAPTPQAKPPRSKWLSVREIFWRLVGGIIFTLIVYEVAGQSFLFFGLEISSYYFGTRTTATITATNATGFFGIPGDDAQDQAGAIASFTDSNGQTHTMFIQHANILHQQIAISYLPVLPEYAVERADYEQRAAFYLVTFLISALILWAYWQYLLRRLLTWRVRVDWKIKTIRKKTRYVMPRRATYRI